MSEIEKLTDSLKRNIDGAKQAQILFVECLAVDWDNKTMTAAGTGDGVEYLEVSLGLGSSFVKPVIGSTCLIGIIDGLEVATFLITAEKVELIEVEAETVNIKAGEKIVFNTGGNVGLVKVKELTNRLNLIEKAFNSLLSDFLAHGHAHPQGATTGFITPPTTSTITETQQANIENNEVIH